MPDISTYTDYRKFLKDYYAEVKTKTPGFSYLAFARMAGLNSKGFIFNIFSGKRTLSRSNILGFIQAMKLDKYEAAYFENLVAFNQARSLKERNSLFRAALIHQSRRKNGMVAADRAQRPVPVLLKVAPQRHPLPDRHLRL